MTELKPLDVLMELARECKRTSQQATAKRLGFTPQFINDVLRGRREITDNLAAQMGYERVTRFVRQAQPVHQKRATVTSIGGKR